MFRRSCSRKRTTRSRSCATRSTGTKCRCARCGRAIVFGVGDDCLVEVLHPPRRGILGSDNANSLVLAVEYRGRRIVLPGDLESPGLDDMLAEEPRRCDVLMAPHHGSRKSNSPGLAAWCKPRWVVFSGDGRWNLPEIDATYEAVGGQTLHTHHLRGDSGANRRRGNPGIAICETKTDIRSLANSEGPTARGGIPATTSMRYISSLLTIVQTLGVEIATLISFAKIETIVYSGPVLSVIGLVIAYISFSRNRPRGFTSDWPPRPLRFSVSRSSPACTGGRTKPESPCCISSLWLPCSMS